MMLPVGEIRDQERLGLGPFASPILFDIPGTGAHIVEEPFALRGIGNQAAKRCIRVVMNKNLTNVENDMLDGCHSTFLLLANASGMAAAMAFFMTVGNASSANFSTLTHQPSELVCLCTPLAV